MPSANPAPAAARALVAVQLLALLLVGVTVVARHHIWAEIDERPHYDYIQKVVEDHRLPRPTDLISPEAQAINDATWPRPSPRDPAGLGLAGRSFEAMQPPLYYLVAAPAFAVVGDHRDKVFAVRVLDLALLLLGTWLVWRLARRLAGADAAIGVFAVAATVLLWPGVVVRGITIGNTPLEIVLASAFMLALWRADGEGRLRPALAAAVLLGLCLLTKFSLFYLVPLFALVLARRLWRAPSRRGLVEAAALAAIPVALLAPWLASNLSRYGSLTVSISGGKGIAPPVDAGGILDRATNLPDLDARLLEGSLAQEFLPQLAVPWVEVAAKGLVVALAAAALATLVAGGRRWRTWFLALPALTGLAIMQLTYLLTGDAPFLLRYIYPALLPLALAIGLEAAERGGIARRAIVPACALATVVAGALWIDVAGAYYFTDLGDKLGI